jgi:RHS repeat-associated protein
VGLTFGGAFARAATLAAYRGVNAATPVGATTTKTANGGTSIAIPSITPTTAGDRLVTIAGALTTSAGTWSPPALMTTRAQAVGANPVIAVDDQGLQGIAATGTRTPTYSLSAQLVGVTLTLKPATTQPTATSYGYNTRGDRTGVTPPAGSATTLGYDQANRLTSYTKGSTSETYAYSGDGLRMSKAGANTATNTWDTTTSSVALLLTDGTFSYVYGPSGPLEQIDNSGTVTWYHTDQLGTVRAATNSSGTVTATATYDPYGNLTASTGTLPRLGYNGQYTDPESGLIYLRARYYDPATAQFLSRDPLVAVTGSSYGYVDDNPLNGTDPTGLAWWNPLDWYSVSFYTIRTRTQARTLLNSLILADEAGLSLPPPLDALGAVASGYTASYEAALTKCLADVRFGAGYSCQIATHNLVGVPLYATSRVVRNMKKPKPGRYTPPKARKTAYESGTCDPEATVFPSEVL